MEQKKCCTCKEWKEMFCFGKHKGQKDGYQRQCKQCKSKQDKKYQKKHKEKISKNKKEYYEENKSKIKEKVKKYQEENKPKIKKYQKKYRSSPMKFSSNGKIRKEIELYENEIRESADGYLECKCVYCGDWFAPNVSIIQHRLSAMNNENMGESRLYCSNPCKQACPTYGQLLYPKGFKPATSREVQPELRQMVLARDNYTCQRCGKHKEELSEECIALHCHHLEGIHWEPLMSADIDMCITYCQPCHVKAHQTPDCSYHDQQCA